MVDKRSRVSTDIDFERDGKQTGYLSLPFSRHASAYGRVLLPIVSIRNGTGPRVLLVAGNHGDEYEGQIALMRLARELTPDQVRGRIVIMPAANLPAVEAANRVSPLDGGNLNRLFPGEPEGGPTTMIAHYIEHVLLAISDYVIDLHSGGSSLEYLPCALIRDSGAPDRVEKTFAAMRAFGAPVTYVTDGRNAGAERTLAAAADRQGVVAITTELGGGATLKQAGLNLAEGGVRRLLRHVGAWRGNAPPNGHATRLLAVEGLDYYVFATEEGVFEPVAIPGDAVREGQLAGYVHLPHAPWREPETVAFRRSGLVICRRFPCATKRGDCLYQIATDYKGAQAA
ncbi:MAG: succinylglutamate desuccinylase/aspartoacylase family protein [Proteobacteria bacterium]|nr:succinylglutamate desuccinylase/aspartoacylase family protein [Pseudomonadota bacterium]